LPKSTLRPSGGVKQDADRLFLDALANFLRVAIGRPQAFDQALADGNAKTISDASFLK
jgi:hypothetical protein